MQDSWKLLKERRNRMMLTQVDVSDALDIGFGTYQRYEHGTVKPERMSLGTGLALCALLDIDPYELAFGTDKETYMLQANFNEKIPQIPHL